MSEEENTIAIVGAGHAGGELAAGLRQVGHTGRIVLIGDEPYLPYQRPPLSKAYLSGKVTVEGLYLRPASTYEAANIETITGVRVEHIDRVAKRLVLSDGRDIFYQKLALATGGRARRLQVERAEEAHRASNHHYVRTIADVDRLRPQFEPGMRIVIVGGGYVGLEVASVAICRGLSVTVLEGMSRVLARVAAPEISAFYEGVHRQAGVDLRTGVTVRGFKLDASGDAVEGVVCRDAEGRDFVQPADLVIVGVGQEPNVELARDAGLEVDNGILVDELCRTSNPDIVAIGDCTNHMNLALGRRIRLESVPNAVEQARTAAATLCGKERPYNAIPWFWSDQYDLKLQMVGISQGYDQSVTRGSMVARSFAVFYLLAGKVIAADAVNRPVEFMVAKRLVGDGTMVSVSRLADESVPLKNLLTPSA